MKAQSFIDAMKRFVSTITDDDMLTIGQFMVEKIRIRTRLGFGVASKGEEKKPLAPLADSTIQARMGHTAFKEIRGTPVQYKRDQQFHGPKVLSSQTRPRMSNLTETGQLLDSIRVKDFGTRSVVVGPDGNRDDGKSNEDIGAYATKGDSKRNRPPRPFNTLSKAELKQVSNFVRSLITEKFKSNLKK